MFYSSNLRESYGQSVQSHEKLHGELGHRYTSDQTHRYILSFMLAPLRKKSFALTPRRKKKRALSEYSQNSFPFLRSITQLDVLHSQASSTKG